MANFDPVSNFAYGTVLTAPSPATTGTSLVLNSGQGARFPDPATVGAYNIVVWITAANPLSSNAEIMRVTARSTDTLTVTREQEGTTARTVVVGDQVMLAPTKRVFDRLSVIANLSQGHMINGKLSVSVASSDLTVALKTLAGNDPSDSDPVFVRIGDTVRAITAALSVTKADGTNWFGAGGVMFAAREIDYFVYLGYNATDGVVIGFSRIPYGTRYDSFSATTTNEKYCAISTITNAAAGDYYELVGRFAATLSGVGTSYLWTVPTFTATNLIQRPIFNTRRSLYLPTHTGFSSPPTNTGTYQIRDTMMFLMMDEATQGTSNATGKTMTLPMSIETSKDWSMVMSLVLDNTAWQTLPGHMRLEGTVAPTVVSIGKTVHMGAWTASGTAGYAFAIFYPIA